MIRLFPAAQRLSPFQAAVVLCAASCGGPAPAQAPDSPQSAAATAPASPTAEVSPAGAPAANVPAATPPGATGDGSTPAASPPAPANAAATTAAAPTAPATASASTKCEAGANFVAGGTYQRTGTKRDATIPDLCVDTLETSVTAYGECVTAGKCTTTGLDCSAQATWAKSGKEQQPVVCIDYDQAAAYCEFRGKRLPTIEEWEWVARSGDEARTYTWGNEPPNDQLCWTGKQRQTESCPVGVHPEDKSAAGVYDLAGNVLEFVTTERDARSPIRIAKGGAWNGGDAALFTNGRLGGFRKEYRCGFLGVRCVAPQAAP